MSKIKRIANFSLWQNLVGSSNRLPMKLKSGRAPRPGSDRVEIAAYAY